MRKFYRKKEKIEFQKVRKINNYNDLNHHPQRRKYQNICGIAFVLSSIITVILSFFASGMNYIAMTIYIIWMLFTIIYPEIGYLPYTSKNKICFFKKHIYDRAFFESICDGIFGSIIIQFYCSFFLVNCIRYYEIYINLYCLLVCPIISLIPFLSACFYETEIKTKIWCFFKYMIFHNLVIAEIIYFAIATMVIWCEEK